MNKYIKNISGSSIICGGKELEDQAFWELTGPNIRKFAFLEKVIDQINNDQILISLDGISTLSKNNSLLVIRQSEFADNISFDNSSNGFSSLDVQKAIEETQITPIGSLDIYNFVENGSANNKWLEHEANSIYSDESPALLPFDSKLIACTFCNDDDGADCDIEIYSAPEGEGEDADRVAIFEIRNLRVARFSNFTPIQFNAGDKISVFLRDQGTNPSRVVVKLYFMISNYNKENSGEDYSSDFSLGIGGITITIGS